MEPSYLANVEIDSFGTLLKLSCQQEQNKKNFMKNYLTKSIELVF